MLLASRIGLDRIGRSGRIELLAADSGHPDRDRWPARPRRILCVPYTNVDSSRRAAANPPFGRWSRSPDVGLRCYALA